MDATRQFAGFDKIIRLTESKKAKLKRSRANLRDHIRTYFKEHKWDEVKFYSQGSLALDTNLNPIPTGEEEYEEYDIDDGVYNKCKKDVRPTEDTFHRRIYAAVQDVTGKVVDKNTCIRVVYAEGYHVDLPMYWLDSECENPVPQLAHKVKGYFDSDPREFSGWAAAKIAKSKDRSQLKRLIRYFKAWVDYREHCNSQIKLPCGFILTILACNNYVADDLDDRAFARTANAILQSLTTNFVCYRPTTPVGEELLGAKNYDRELLLKEFSKVADDSSRAIETDSQEKATDLWQGIFGDRFPTIEDMGEKKVIDAGSTNSSFTPDAPWSAP